MGRPRKEVEDISEASVLHVADCKLGHCSCYYTNLNVCCRCHNPQYDRKPITSNVSLMEPKREAEAKGIGRGNRWSSNRGSTKVIFLD